MQERDRFSEITPWLRWAEEDLITAETCLTYPDIRPRQTCWLARQAAEKSLIAILSFSEIDFPRTDDLDVLRNLVPDGWNLQSLSPDLSELTRWGIEILYPNDLPAITSEDAAAAVEHARSIWTTVSAEFVGRG